MVKSLMEYSKNIVWVVSLCLLALFDNGVEASHKVYPHLQNQECTNVKELLRTGYHFQPTKHWINDPNGPMYFNGYYHLFYQYNPKGAVWGNIVWAHSVSKDLVNWKKVEHAIYPSKPFDQFGCWSGSATVLPGNKPVILYTGIIDKNNTQVQNYAVPADLSDPFLTKWVKPDSNPIIVADKTVNKTSFRDPTTAWKTTHPLWHLTPPGRHKAMGVAYMYRSKDFVKWEKVDHYLHSKEGTGNWECPDFYPVSTKEGLDTTVTGKGIKHVFKVSLDATRYDYYTIGTYDQEQDKYIPDKGMVDGWNGLRYDYGNFYASKSFYDPAQKRRILWGWANESDTTDNDVAKGWAGVQLIPREILLDPSGKQLLQSPIDEIETLRGQTVSLDNTKLEHGAKTEVEKITAAQADVDVIFTFKPDKAEPFDPSWDKYDGQKLCGQKDSTVPGALGPFGLATLASANLEEYTPVFFRIYKDQDKLKVLMCSDASRSSLMDSKHVREDKKIKEPKDAYRPSFGGFVDIGLDETKLSLRTLIDNSVVESFGAGGKIAITSRVYPTLAVNDKAHLFAFNNGTEEIGLALLDAWSMKKPEKMNH